MKNLFFPLTAVMLLMMIGCKPAEKEVAVEIPKTMFDVMRVAHPVKDYNAWLPYYIDHDSVRRSYGIEPWAIARGIQDSNMVYIFQKFNDYAKVKELAAMPELKTLMDSAGVTGAPTFDYMHVVRLDTSHNELKERLMVRAKVKDFPTFLKVFDGEGPATRQEHGFYDRGLGRALEDSNTVYVVLAISDMTKAQARMQSEELKKLMGEAGVEGEPEFVWYRVVR